MTTVFEIRPVVLEAGSVEWAGVFTRGPVTPLTVETVSTTEIVSSSRVGARVATFQGFTWLGQQNAKYQVSQFSSYLQDIDYLGVTNLQVWWDPVELHQLSPSQ